MVACIALLHLVGLVTLLAAQSLHAFAGAKALGFGIGLSAYLLGIRHAFDADHIAAIDNATRKLAAGGGRPSPSVGFWFSIGHSSVVLLLTLVLSFGAHGAGRGLLAPDGTFRHDSGLLGTLVSSGFLYLIALLNVVFLGDALRRLHRLRRGLETDAHEASHGGRIAANPLVRRAMRLINEPWQMCGVGILFGLGFDTASEIGLLVLAASASGSGVPWYAALCIPILFAAAMSLVDAADGFLMSMTYARSLQNPIHSIYYDLAVTGMSVAVALLVGTMQIVGAAGAALDLRGSLWDRIRTGDASAVGMLIAAMFLIVWAAAAAAGKLANLRGAGVRQETPAGRS